MDKPKRAAKPHYSYSYDPATGRYSMDAPSLMMWLMDVEGRGRLERALSKACDQIEAMLPEHGAEMTAEYRKLVPKKEPKGG